MKIICRNLKKYSSFSKRSDRCRPTCFRAERAEMSSVNRPEKAIAERNDKSDQALPKPSLAKAPTENSYRDKHIRPSELTSPRSLQDALLHRLRLLRIAYSVRN